jgi:hypothetical protein
MSTDVSDRSAPAASRSASASLSPRVRRLRDEFFSFNTRDHFRNEVRPYGSGTPWDEVWSPYNWGVVPEMYVFDSFMTASRRRRDRPLPASRTGRPAGFWTSPVVTGPLLPQISSTTCR